MIDNKKIINSKNIEILLIVRGKTSQNQAKKNEFNIFL